MTYQLVVSKGVIDRKPQILDVASELLQSRSYTAFSYKDLSERLGITKASIHHHFPTKEDLLVALAERYASGQRKILREIDEAYDKPWDRLEAFVSALARIMVSGQKICPVGALQCEFNVIPERAKETTRDLFLTPKRWLSGVLAEGRECGEMVFEGSPEERAVLILAAIQGALQIARAHGPAQFTAVSQQIRAGLKAPVGRFSISTTR